MKPERPINKTIRKLEKKIKRKKAPCWGDDEIDLVILRCFVVKD